MADELIKTTIEVNLVLEAYENFAVLSGWLEYVPRVNNKGVEEMIPNPLTKLEYAQEMLRALVKRNIADAYTFYETKRLEGELKDYRQTIDSQIDAAVSQKVEAKP